MACRCVYIQWVVAICEVIAPNTALRAAAENVDFALARDATPRGAAPYSSSSPSTTKTRPPSPFATITSANKTASRKEDHVARSCLFSSGCCQRHPISCRDTSRLRLAPAPASSGSCSGDSVYTRPGRTGSKYTAQYFHDTAGCAQWGAFHDTLANGLPAHQRKVTVLREPCSRAKSLLSHWQREFPPAHPIQRIKTLPQLVVYLKSNWPQITRTPWPENDAALHHYIVGWPQSWYVDRCTRILCYERIETELPAFCAARRRGESGDAPSAAAAAWSNASSAPGCAEIRSLYAEDARLHDTYCAAPRRGGRRELTESSATSVHESGNSSSSSSSSSSAIGPPTARRGLLEAGGCESTRRQVGILLVGLVGSSPRVHMEATRDLVHSFASRPLDPCAARSGGSACVVTVSDGHELSSLNILSVLGSAVAALGVVSTTPLARPSYLPHSAAFRTLPPPPSASPPLRGGLFQQHAAAATRRLWL